VTASRRAPAVWSTRVVAPRLPHLAPGSFALPGLALLALAPLAACSDDEKATPISQQVAQATAEQLGLPVGEVSATCPADAEAKQGAEFLCELQVDGQDVIAGVVFTTDEEFGVQLAAEVRDKAELEAEVKDELARRFQGIDIATVDCAGGEEVVVIAAGKTVDCQAEDTVGGKATATVGLNAEARAEIQSVTDPAYQVPG
jgi:hypothetical protein